MGERGRIRRDTRKIVVVVVVCVVILGLLGRRVYKVRQADPGIDETGVVTVVSVIGGYSSKFGGGRAAHRVRLESGSEGTMTFRQIFPPGARVWVSYRRYPKTGRLLVKLYVRRGEP